MKKIISILLIFAISSPFWLFFSILQFEKYGIRKEIKKNIIAGINRNELVLLKFSQKEIETELKWEHSKEFEYRNEMYDVVETETRNDSIFYWCWWDYKETNLNKKLDKLVEQNSGMNKKTAEQASRISVFFSSFYQNNFSADFDLKFPVSKALFPNRLLNCLSRYTIPDTPPPKS